MDGPQSNECPAFLEARIRVRSICDRALHEPAVLHQALLRTLESCGYDMLDPGLSPTLSIRWGVAPEDKRTRDTQQGGPEE